MDRRPIGGMEIADVDELNLILDPPFTLRPGEKISIQRRRDGTLVSATLETGEGITIPLAIRVRYLDEPRFELIRPGDGADRDAGRLRRIDDDGWNQR